MTNVTVRVTSATTVRFGKSGNSLIEKIGKLNRQILSEQNTD